MAKGENSASPPLITLPAGWTFAALAAGLALGWLLAGTTVIDPVLSVTRPIGNLWLRALQMTIIPLVAALLVMGISGLVATARAGRMARRTLLMFFVVLLGGTLLTALAMPSLLDWLPVPESARMALAGGPSTPQAVPGIGDFIEALIAPNVIAAAAETAMLPLIIFFTLFALAITRLAAEQRDLLIQLFRALAHAMLVIIGWVLRIAPIGVFALALGVAAQSGGGAIAALTHYVALVAAFGLAVMLAAYGVAVGWARLPLLRFARAVFPAQAVALSTQSSLASLPAMLTSCRDLGVRATTADFVLPLAVAIFRATSPAMNLAVAIYVAKLTGTAITPATLAAGVAVAMVTTVGSVSLPGTVTFVTSIGPIALAMGVPVEPLALLVAVEMLPDIMRTVGNVTMDVAVTASVDARVERDPKVEN
ncbi:cation:dicarboxylase symporter family transporter [Altererythrobacter xixiisoli]|uniref:Cation:dicarboxylase symporter family transporter n=1 Tax=Croceibacterium xixiisoli TaxID=1476466 RepID=A0A6I4TPY3_9SPHN|nr:dicarboxylate/amino acid:cation symporter [Croceibacterium xixiisoli]MXO97924.1 cation:dicarboxylase symporter family transporter [Croceibacterium xixiisoli]